MLLLMTMFHLSCPSQLLRLLLRGPRLWEEGGPLHVVILVPALDPRSSGGRGQAPPLPSLEGSPGGASACLVLWRAVIPSPVGKVYSGGPLQGHFGVGYATEVSPFSLPLSLSRWEPPSRLLRRKRFPLP
jgi:hypothetical protein